MTLASCQITRTNGLMVRCVRRGKPVFIGSFIYVLLLGDVIWLLFFVLFFYVFLLLYFCYLTLRSHALRSDFVFLIPIAIMQRFHLHTVFLKEVCKFLSFFVILLNICFYSNVPHHVKKDIHILMREQAIGITLQYP